MWLVLHRTQLQVDSVFASAAVVLSLLSRQLHLVASADKGPSIATKCQGACAVTAHEVGCMHAVNSAFACTCLARNGEQC